MQTLLTIKYLLNIKIIQKNSKKNNINLVEIC